MSILKAPVRQDEAVVALDAPYEAPQLTPIGSLHDLLAHTSGSQCDDLATTGTGIDQGMCG